MRRIFIVLAKLIGLLQIYWGLTYLSSIALFIGQMARIESSDMGTLASQIGGILGFSLLAFGMAWLLLARTEWLADKLRIPSDQPLPALSDDVVLRAGIKVVGVYILANAIPGLAKSIADASANGLWDGRLIFIWTQIIPSVLKIALALLLAIRTDRVLTLLAQGEKTHGKRILLGGVALLALLILLGRGLTIHPWLQPRDSTGPIYSSCSSESVVFIEEDPQPPSAYTMHSDPYGEPITNDLPGHTNFGLVQTIDFLIDEVEQTEPIAAPSSSDETPVKLR